MLLSECAVLNIQLRISTFDSDRLFIALKSQTEYCTEKKTKRMKEISTIDL